MLEKDGIIYELLQEKDLEKTIACVTDVFTSREPLTTALELTQDEFYPFAKMFCDKAVEDQLSYITKDAATDEVIGFLIAEDLIQEPDFQESYHRLFQELVKIQPLIDVVDKLEEKYLENKKITKGEVFHMFLGGIQQSYEHRGIPEIALEELLESAQKRNYRAAIIEVSGLHSQRNMLQAGFQEKCSIDYQDYTYEGKRVFAGLPKINKRCILMEKIF
ncbi:MAG: hypothetical protein F6J96_32755 [Symploca sp. SIO1C2]|nr:hypothetical protein [Symploca sp. SIO1C2]